MNKLQTTLGAALVTISMNAFAGDCTPLAGQYTIGKSEGANFSSINAATSALKCGGITASVIFKIEKGTYNEQVVISTIKGASAFKTVTFESATGDNADAVISYTSDNATVVLNGISYVSFKNVTIDHKSANSGNCMRVEGQSNNISFKSVAFYGVNCTKTGTDYATIYFTASAPKTAVSFKDCEINNGSTGIAKAGVSNQQPDSKTSISNTLFFNQYEGALALTNEDAPFIGSNVVSSASTYSSFKAISLDNVSNSVVVRGNIINATAGSMGVALNNCVAQVSNTGQITENSITIGGQSEAYGIYLSGSTNNQIFSFNKVKLSANAHTSTQSYYKNASTGNHIAMLSNIGYDLNANDYVATGTSFKNIISQLAPQNNTTL